MNEHPVRRVHSPRPVPTRSRPASRPTHRPPPRPLPLRNLCVDSPCGLRGLPRSQLSAATAPSSEELTSASFGLRPSSWTAPASASHAQGASCPPVSRFHSSNVSLENVSLHEELSKLAALCLTLERHHPSTLCLATDAASGRVVPQNRTRVYFEPESVEGIVHLAHRSANYRCPPGPQRTRESPVPHCVRPLNHRHSRRPARRPAVVAVVSPLRYCTSLQTTSG